MDVQNTTELLDFTITVLKDVNAAKADGKISLMEIIQLAIKDASPAIKAAVGADQVPAELKDLSPDEVKLLAEKGVELAKVVMAFFGKAA
jgi:hypothetical protein